MKDFKCVVRNLEKPMQIKEFLLKQGFSKTLIKRVKYGGIKVNGECVTVRKEVTNESLIEIDFGIKSSENIEPINIPLNVIYEDDDILVVDKPCNMPTHPSRGNSLPTLANAVMAKYDGNFTFRSITRLDRDTSGLVLIAKDELSAQRLSVSMRAGKFEKKYICITSGIPSPKEGRIEAPIRRESPDSIKRTVASDGKHAITEYRVVEIKGENALCEINLLTGRTHQIRVHMAYIGHPLLGDFLYGSRLDESYYLRCFELIFPHPTTGKTIDIRI